MRIAHIVASIEDEASGPSYSVPALCRAQISRGHEVELHTLSAPNESPEWVVSHMRAFGTPPRLGVSGAMRRGTQQLVDSFDIIHVHGLWMMPNVYPFLPVESTAARVLSPRGTLLPVALKHHRLRKRIFWTLGQRVALRADGYHATSTAEADAIARFGMFGPTAVIPNGIDVAVDPSYPGQERRRVGYIGRLHPIKGVDLLLRAWSQVEAECLEWDLTIAGPSELGTDAQLRQLAGDLGLQRVSFVGPIFGDDKDRLLADLDVFVLPTRSENFGMTVLEALGQATPVITTVAAPWQGLEEQRCGWWVDVSTGAIAEALREAISMPRMQIAEMGIRGHRWVSEDYSWERVVDRMDAFYLSALRT